MRMKGQGRQGRPVTLLVSKSPPILVESGILGQECLAAWQHEPILHAMAGAIGASRGFGGVIASIRGCW